LNSLSQVVQSQGFIPKGGQICVLIDRDDWIGEFWADPEDVEVALFADAIEGSRAGVVCAR
jgi:hypothetical protein